jgi:hypothetical protein
VRGEGANRVRFFQPTADDELCHVRYMCCARSKGKRRAQDCGAMHKIYFPTRQIFVLSIAMHKGRKGVGMNTDATEVYTGVIRGKSKRFR